MKNVLIIGGNRGVGLEITKSCINLNYNVAVICKEDEINLSDADKSKILLKQIDIIDVSSTKQFVADLLLSWKKIDAVVFYAGITPLSSITDCSEELFDEIIAVNLKSIFFITQSVIENMIEFGGGSFIFFGTSHMDSGMIDRAAYAISKGGMKILAEHIARRYAKYKIRSNIIVMGWTPTEGELQLRLSLGMTKEELVAEASAYIPMGRMLTVFDPIPAVLYFISDESSMVTGSTVRINGGEYI